MMLKEIDFCGVYLPPLLGHMVFAAALYVPIHWNWDRIRLQRHVWNRPVFELAVFVILLGVTTIIL